MAAKSSNTGGEKKGLIISLVLFVLLSIGLGVSTYYGFAEKAEFVKKRAEAEELKKEADNQRDYYKYKALLAKERAALPFSDEEKADWEALKTKTFDKYAEKNLDVIKNIRIPLSEEIAQLRTELEGALRQFKDSEQNQKNQEERIAKLDKDLRDKEQQYQAKIADLNKRLTEAESTKSAEFASLVQVNEDLKTNEINKFREEARTAQDEAKKLKNELDKLKKANDERIRAEETRKDDEEFKRNPNKGVEQIRFDEPKGRIVRLDKNGFVFIDLGEKDRVKPGLTFSVTGATIDGKSDLKIKATAEIVSVIGPHISKARIKDTEDTFKNPVLQDDLLFHPSWSKDRRHHIAIAGVIDLNGDGEDDTAEFLRALDKAGVLVDAILDLKDVKIVGDITPQTEYLILGAMPSYDPGRELMEDSADRKLYREQMDKKRSELRRQAKDLGVHEIRAREYLAQIGLVLKLESIPRNYDPHTMQSVEDLLGKAKEDKSKPKGEVKPKPEEER